MSKLEKAYISLQQMEKRASGIPPAVDPRIDLIVTVGYLAVMLSVPVGRLSMLIWFALYPLLASAYHGISFGKIFVRSLYVIPIVLLIGVFNPVFDRSVAFRVAGINVSAGWITFLSIIVRGLLAMQAILILIESCGFTGVCRALRGLGVPSFLTDQLQFVYRYMSVLILEALTMRRAVASRGYGRKSLPIRLWGVFAGQLFLRAIGRAERVNGAMAARGFTGTLPHFGGKERGIDIGDILYLVVVSCGLAALRIFDLSNLFNLTERILNIR